MHLLIWALLAATPHNAAPLTSSVKRCDYDHRVLELGFKDFDQDMKGGWRSPADQQGCEDKAADVVRHYRQKTVSVIHLLYWHEAQLRAFSGENNEAVILMEQSRKPDTADPSGWNPYVDATIAFLRNDRSAFLKAQDRLKHYKKPSDWPTDAEWPQNASVVQGLWKCFGEPYSAAYDASCRK